MRVIILAAGYAVRLRPLTLNTPKPLLAIGDKKIIDIIIDKIAELDGVESIHIVTNARFFPNFSQWLKTSEHKDKVSLVNDGTVSNETRLGAIRDMELAIEEGGIDDDILVIAGDNLFDFDLKKFISFARTNSDGVSLALYDIKALELAKKFGVVKIDKDNRVIDFKEKPEAPESTTVSTGIYYFPRQKMPLIKTYTRMQTKLDAPGYYMSWMSKVDRVYGFNFQEDWCDIGDIESYEKANKKYTKKGDGR